MNVFFSHSSRDKALVRELKGYFPPWLTVWVDEDRLLFGSDIELSLKNAINDEVDYVVLFLGHEAVSSPWVRREIEWALSREEALGRVFLLPVLLADVRDRMTELGLKGRLTCEIDDFTKDGTRTLAQKIANHIGGWLSERLRNQSIIKSEGKSTKNSETDSYTDLVDSIVTTLRSSSHSWKSQVETILLRPFLQNLISSELGEIPLSPSQYYQSILSEIRNAEKGWEVIAVSTLSSELWKADTNQTNYARCNITAAERGATIRRIFVLPQGSEQKYKGTIEKQMNSNISVKVANTNLLVHVNELEDFVLFSPMEGNRAYISHPTIDASNRIRSGKLIVSPHLTSRLISMFSSAWDMAVHPHDFYKKLSKRSTELKPAGAPGLSLRTYYLSKPVITCEEAATARGIPLPNELKTLILETSNGLMAAHLPGDSTLSLQKVKRYLESEQAYLADPETLLNLGLSAGTVSAVLEPVWSMPHLISRRVLDLKEVMTNNGTKIGYFAFDPALLTHAANVRVDEFEKW